MGFKENYELFLSKLSEAERQNYFSKLEFDAKNSLANELVFIAKNPLMANFISTKYSLSLQNFFESHQDIRPNIKIRTKKNKLFYKKNHSLNIQELKNQSTILNPSFTFQSFVVGPCNQFAYSTMQAACDDLGLLYNPIFIYGSTGLGKTHLLQAFGNYCLELGKRVIYATSENFMNDYSSHMRNKTFDKFKEKYRLADVLLVDDVQFLGKTDTIQEEFFHTFNELKAHDGQIIMSSDVAPNMLKGIEERLRTRFANGIITDITPPELDTKIAIIKSKCQFNDILLDDEIIRYIASKMGDNIREIEGMIINLNAYARIAKVEITLELAKSTMKDHIKEKKENIEIDDILKEISRYFNIKQSEIKSNKKTKKVVEARRIAIFLAREFTTMSAASLARYFNLKDHTSISHNIKKITKLLKEDRKLEGITEDIKTKILIIKQS